LTVPDEWGVLKPICRSFRLARSSSSLFFLITWAISSFQLVVLLHELDDDLFGQLL